MPAATSPQNESTDEGINIPTVLDVRVTSARAM